MAEILLYLAIFLAIVTVVGHGLWVILAWMFTLGTESGETKPGDPLKLQFCPRCALELEAGRCRACDWPQPIEFAKKRPIAALDALAARIDHLANLGLLDSAALQNFSQVLAAERQRLLNAQGTAAPAQKDGRQDEEFISADLVDESIAPVAPTPVPRPRDDREFASAVPVEIRAQQFAVRQERQPAVEVAGEPLPPRPTLTDWLAAFMEERNMRWGELVGGLLIVCCSIALVVSFWSAIAERPLLKFLLFNGVTACLFGIGFHSEHLWRLHTTSQGLLIIATLLVPLNFLAIAAFSRSDAGEYLLTISGEAVSVALFSALVYWAGKIIVDGRAAVLAVGMLVPSVVQLLVRRYVDPLTSQGVLVQLAALPVACYLLVNGWVLQRTAAALRLSETEVNGLFKFFGVTTFAALLPLGLLLVNTERPMQALHQLPMMASLLGVIPLSAGLLLWQKLSGAGLTSLRMAGTSVAVFGALLSLSGLVLGWPDPILMLPAGLVEFALFTFVAWRFGLPAAHGVAAACLALSYLLGVYLADHQISRLDQDSGQLAEIMISGPTGTLLAPLALAYAAVAYTLRCGNFRSPNTLVCVTALLAGVSLALVSWFGFGVEGDPIGAAWVYLLYAAGCLAISARSNRVAIAWLAAALLLAAVLQAVIFRYESQLAYAESELAAILLYGSLGVAIAMVVGRSRWVRDDSPLGDVLWNASFFSSLAAAIWLAVLAPGQTAAFKAGHWLWLALLWLAVAASTGWLPVWTCFQVALSVSVVFGAASQLEAHAWFAESNRPWLDPWTWQAVGIALAVLNLAWAALRIICRHWSERATEDDWSGRATKLLNSPWLAVDRVTSGALVALVVMLGTYAALPGVRQELSPRDMSAVSSVAGAIPATPPRRIVPPIENFQLKRIPHEHAGDWGSWLLLASLLVLLAAIVRERVSQAWLLCAFVTAAVSCPLLASRWESEVAVASALRWFSAGLLLFGSMPIWGRDWFARQAARLGWRPPETGWNVVSNARGLVFFLGLVPPVAMALGIGSQALGRS
ncbi:MAG: hypothetical protein HY288_16940, partial [Planctomycetia bacterium]|nr:hypothetical protein [Planctomycetia bacterium]